MLFKSKVVAIGFFVVTSSIFLVSCKKDDNSKGGTNGGTTNGNLNVWYSGGNSGTMSVYVDGNLAGTLDFYCSSAPNCGDNSRCQLTISLSPGSHTFHVVSSRDGDMNYAPVNIAGNGSCTTIQLV